ncbi:MAG: hypothetical protein ACR2Q4_24990 [Geminicoccaceae bacterium]
MTNRTFRLLRIMPFSLLVLGACSPQNFGSQGQVSTIDAGTASHLDARLTGADFKRFAEGITDKMLTSRQAQSWMDKQPRLVVGDIVNNTDNENLRVADIYDGIQERLLEAELVRILDKSSTDFDYVVKPEVTSTRQRDGDTNQQLAFYTLKLKLFSLDGELVGQWSDETAFAQAAKSWF